MKNNTGKSVYVLLSDIRISPVRALNGGENDDLKKSIGTIFLEFIELIFKLQQLHNYCLIIIFFIFQ